MREAGDVIKRGFTQRRLRFSVGDTSPDTGCGSGPGTAAPPTIDHWMRSEKNR